MGRRKKLYAVEALVAKRVTIDGHVEYLVKWEGYSSEQNSWEPEANIESKELIDEFEELHRMPKRNHKALNHRYFSTVLYRLAVVVFVFLLIMIIANFVY